MNEPDNVTYEFGPFLQEPHARRLSRHGEPVPLAAAEFELLLLLVRNSGRVVEKKEIMASVWMDVEVEENGSSAPERPTRAPATPQLFGDYRSTARLQVLS